tara:strand:+ start:4579 stop:5139 length:561 start_codon:yes stop_codon:yes gene_type:complete
MELANDPIPHASPIIESNNNIPIGICLTEYNTDVWIQEPVPEVIVVNATRTYQSKYNGAIVLCFRDNIINLMISFFFQIYTQYYVLSALLSVYGFLAIAHSNRDSCHLRLLFLGEVVQIQFRLVFFVYSCYKKLYLLLLLCGIGSICDASLIINTTIISVPNPNRHIREIPPLEAIENISEEVNNV